MTSDVVRLLHPPGNDESIAHLYGPGHGEPGLSARWAHGEVTTTMVRAGARRTGDARLLARPGQPRADITPGLHHLGLDGDRDALLYVPTGYRPAQPAPVVLSLHGAGGVEASGLYPLRDLADAAGLILLSPASRGRT